MSPATSPILPSEDIDSLYHLETAMFRLNRYQRLFMANRGVWEAVLTAGPAISFVMTQEDVNYYLDVFEQMVVSIITSEP
jgi:hypothetical protein